MPANDSEASPRAGGADTERWYGLSSLGISRPGNLRDEFDLGLKRSRTWITEAGNSAPLSPAVPSGRAKLAADEIGEICRPQRLEKVEGLL
jgi:hypothetical protein